MLVISSREFRQNQKLYFEKADKGEQIIVQRGNDKAYALTPVGKSDVYLGEQNSKRLFTERLFNQQSDEPVRR